MVIQIKLNRSDRKPYSAGECVDGNVVITTPHPDKVKEITISLEGNGKVNWLESIRHMDRPPTQIQHDAEENYLSYRISLVDDDVAVTLPEGTIVVPFRFNLPTSLPSSFKCDMGKISYSLEAEIRRPFLIKNDRVSLPVIVNGIYDLSTVAGAGLPQVCKNVKGSNIFANRRGQIGFVLSLPKKSGFVPGEVLDFCAQIKNDSNQNVNWVKASLQRILTFRDQQGPEGRKKIVNEMVGPGVESGEKDVLWSPRNFLVPPVPPTTLGGNCTLLDIKYFLLFEMDISGISDSLEGQLPVVIGTVPVKSKID